MDEAGPQAVAARDDTPQAAAVFGEPVRTEDVTVIPVARCRRRASGGKRPSVVLDTVPVGCIEIRPQGARFVPIRSTGAVGVLSVIGATLVFCLGIVGWAWGRPRPEGKP